GVVNSRSISELTIWDQLAREGKRSIIIGVPPGYPPRRINGISVSCFLTPDTDSDVFTHPAELSEEIRRLVTHYPVDVKGFRTDDKSWLRDQIFAMSRTQFRVVRHLLQTQPWDYFQYVDIGLDRVHHGSWKCFPKRPSWQSSRTTVPSVWMGGSVSTSGWCGKDYWCLTAIPRRSHLSVSWT